MAGLIAGKHCLGRAAVAVAGDRFGSLRLRLVVVAQFRVQRGLDQGFLERHTGFIW
jgi:hypothetical protein